MCAAPSGDMHTKSGPAHHKRPCTLQAGVQAAFVCDQHVSAERELGAGPVISRNVRWPDLSCMSGAMELPWSCVLCDAAHA